MNNIYNAIQNVYNMDKTTWQEVLAELYNLVSNIENKFDLFELKFGSLLGEQVTRELKKMCDDGSLASLINDKLLKDINTKVTEVSEQLDTITRYNTIEKILQAMSNGNLIKGVAFGDVANLVKIKDTTFNAHDESKDIIIKLECNGTSVKIYIDDNLVFDNELYIGQLYISLITYKQTDVSSISKISKIETID